MGTTNILDLNNRVSDLEKAVSGGDSAQANKKDIATEFSATTAYTAGCFVYYQGKLYQFNTDHTAGAWDPTDVVEANVTDQIVSNKAAIDGLTASDIMMSDGVTSVEDALDGLIVVDYGINAVACDTAWGQGFLSSVISVNIASLSLQNKPTVLSATYEPVNNTNIASTLVETVSNAQINFYLSRLTASVSQTGVVHFYLKSNG